MFITHQAAPTTDREMARPTPKLDHMYGVISSKNLQKIINNIWYYWLWKVI